MHLKNVSNGSHKLLLLRCALVIRRWSKSRVLVVSDKYSKYQEIDKLYIPKMMQQMPQLTIAPCNRGRLSKTIYLVNI